jgi:hypothetical protein
VVITALLPAHTFAANSAASRLGLVPLSPGGSLSDPPQYSPDELAQVSFGVYLDPELRGGDAEAYLQERALVCQSSYNVQLFAGDAENAAPLENLVTQDEGGAIRLAAESLTPGTVYGWRVVATLPDGSSVVSMPLYFTLADASTDDFAAVSTLVRQLTAEQYREALALDAVLAGRLIYDTYPTATDSYICAPLGQDEFAPLPAQSGGRMLPAQIIPLLGALMQRADEVQQALRAGGEPGAQLDELTGQLAQLTGSVSYGKVLTARAPDIGALLARINAARSDPEQLVAQLSELRLALDSAVGSGSLDLRLGWVDAFRAYAERGEQRLARIVGFQSYFESLYGVDEAAALTLLLDDQRAALALLRDEVGRGRLSKLQLGQRVRAQAQRAAQASFRAYTLIDGVTCRPLENTKASPEQQQELLHCELARLISAVWPD